MNETVLLSTKTVTCRVRLRPTVERTLSAGRRIRDAFLELARPGRTPTFLYLIPSSSVSNVVVDGHVRFALSTKLTLVLRLAFTSSPARVFALQSCTDQGALTVRLDRLPTLTSEYPRLGTATVPS